MIPLPAGSRAAAAAGSPVRSWSVRNQSAGILLSRQELAALRRRARLASVAADSLTLAICVIDRMPTSIPSSGAELVGRYQSVVANIHAAAAAANRPLGSVTLIAVSKT